MSKITEEKKIQNEIISYLCSLPNCYVERRSPLGFSYKKGIADLFFVYRGIHVEVEVKKIDGTTSPMQDKWKERCERLLIPYIEAHSKEDVKKWIENLNSFKKKYLY